MATPGPIEKRSLDRQAADWIREAIASGNLAPGMRLTEHELSAQIGLSRSTVRSAMQRVAGEGLLVQQPYAGWEVLSLSAEDAWELYTLRSALEGLAARLAAQRIDDAGRDILTSALREFKHAVAAGDRRSVARTDLQIHKTIVTVCGHKRLAAQYAQVIDPALLYIVSTNTMVASPDDLIADHEELVSLVIAGRAKQAEKLAFDHVTNSGKRMIEVLEAKARER